MYSYNWFEGAVRVRLKGVSVERFINLCSYRGIKIWDLEYNNEKCTFCMYRKDYFRTGEIYRITKVRPVIEEKEGLPYIIHKYRKHYCFLVGIMLSFFLMYYLSNYLWDISFFGNYIYSTDELSSCVEAGGISYGMRLRDIDCDDIELYIRNQLEDITWVSAKISGTRLIIDIKENDGDKMQTTDKKSSNIVATRAGVVYSIITRTGTPMVKCGDTVSVGDVLISGRVDVKDDNGNIIDVKYVSSDGDILIENSYDYEDCIDKHYKYKVYTNNIKKSYYLSVWDKVLVLGKKINYEYFSMNSKDTQVKLLYNYYLPIHYGCKEYYEYYLEDGVYTETEALNILERNFSYYLQNLQQKLVQIITNDVTIEENAVSYRYRGKVFVREYAVAEELLIEPEANGQKE